MNDAVNIRAKELTLLRQIEAPIIHVSGILSFMFAITVSSRFRRRVAGMAAECHAGIGAALVILQRRLAGGLEIPRTFGQPPRSHRPNGQPGIAAVSTANVIDGGALLTASAGGSAHGVWRRWNAAAGGRPIGIEAHEPFGESASGQRLRNGSARW